MSTNYHTAIPPNSLANTSVLNAPLAQLDEAISNAGGGVTGVLKAWVEAGAYQTPVPVYHASGTLETGTTLLWPDGSIGVLTVTDRSTNVNALDMIDGYTVTHVSGGVTITQAAVTRGIDGNVTVQPALTVA